MYVHEYNWISISLQSTEFFIDSVIVSSFLNSLVQVSLQKR